MDVDATAESSSNNAIPSPPPEASPLALQRALKRKVRSRSLLQNRIPYA